MNIFGGEVGEEDTFGVSVNKEKLAFETIDS